MPKLIIFSPLPPARNGIADYTNSLLDHHRRDFDCAVVVSDGSPEPVNLPSDVTLLRDAEYTRFANTFRDVPHLFHVGNNADHRYMLDHLRVRSGIVVVHDLTLHHLIADSFAANTVDAGTFVEVNWRSHGPPGRFLAEQVVQYGWHHLVNHLDLNCLRFALHQASGAISHSWLGVTRIQGLRPDLPVKRIELFAETAQDTRTARRESARAQLGLDRTHTIFVTLGFVTPAKQVFELMDVMAELCRHIGHFSYLLVGESHGIAVEQEAERRGIGHIIRSLGYVEDCDFSLYIDAADVVLNLRNPTFGETSSVLCRALGRGACCVVTDHGWYSELPDRVVAKVPALPGREGQVVGVLLKLVRDHARRKRFEAEAQAWAASTLAIERIAGEYRDFILKHQSERSRPAGPIALAAAGGRTHLGAGTDRTFLGSLWQNEALIPRRKGSAKLKLSAPDGATAPIAASLPGFNVDATLEPGDCGLYVGTWEEVERDARRLADFAACLQEDGIALIDLWSEIDGSMFDVSDANVEEYLADLDFKVVMIVREPSRLNAVANITRKEIAVIAQRMTTLRHPASERA